MGFVKIGQEIGALVEKKNAAYGNSFINAAKILRILYPNGISIDQYQDVLTVVRIIDKLGRIANEKDAFGEDPWRDMAGYCILELQRQEDDKEKEKASNSGF